MKATICTINEKGLAEIQQFLAENHKRGDGWVTPDMLHAWASEAEFQLGEGNPATIEIPAHDSIYGRAQEYTISDDGIYSETVEIDD